MNERIQRWGGGAVVALAVIGLVAFVGALLAFFSRNLAAAGICLAAAAIAFSGIANVIVRR